MTLTKSVDIPKEVPPVSFLSDMFSLGRISCWNCVWEIVGVVADLLAWVIRGNTRFWPRWFRRIMKISLV